MTMLLSGAWWAQRLAGAGTMAAIAASVAGVLAVLVATGLWWVRADAAADERGRCVIEQAQAKREADNQVAGRVATSERIAREQREVLAAELAAARKRAAELEDLLAAPRPVAVAPAMCWPAAVSRKLNEARRQLK